MRKFFFAVTILLVLLTLVSCDWISKDEYASVSFAKETKALQVTTNASEVLVDNYIWYYKAEKTDGGPNAGSKTNWTRVNPNSYGLSGILSGFSVGSWTFKLYKTQSSEIPEASVSATATVNATLVSGKVNNISVDIDLNSTSGNGSLQFKDIVVPNNDGYGTWTYKIDDAEAVSIELDANNKLNKTISISSGTKTVQFTGTYTGSVVGSSITATVYSGVTTIISGSIDNLTVSYSLTYNANTTASYEGTLPTTSSFNSGSTVTVSSNVLTRSGYIFDGWNTKANGSGTAYKSGDTFNIAEDTTLYAVWIKSYTVTYLANTDSTYTGTLPETKVYATGSTVTITTNVLSMDGMTFKGWNTKSDWSGTKYTAGQTLTIKSDVTLYAMWAVTGTKYTVTFDRNTGDGAEVPSITVDAGDVVTLPNGKSTTKTRTDNNSNTRGYALAGWNKTADGTGTNYATSSTFIPTSNITLYAQWQGWVQLWEGGEKWAEFNVGSTIKDYSSANATGNSKDIYAKAFVGGYYTWGGSENKSVTDYADVSKYKPNGNLTAEDDTATKLWGDNWEMPTLDMLMALIGGSDYYGVTETGCSYLKWSKCNGTTNQYVEGCTMSGWKVCGKGDVYGQNSIFIPNAGYVYATNAVGFDGERFFLWSRTIKNNSIRVLKPGASTYIQIVSEYAPYGQSIRAVLK